ncbi:MAG: hypothetical protein ISS93_03010, partial [Candidatus Aenigmarchaeota archaeon]|nr:hypothetical protein [Candidatus Aenigmarchaeota archaeon]
MIACNKIGGRCECPCPAPENCEKRVDENGFTHIICKDPGQECPKLPQGMVQRCIDEGGRLVADRQGDCLVRECVFEKEPPPFYGRPECPDPAGIEKQEKVCKDMGQEFIITFDQGCKIGKCIDKWQRCDVDYAQIQQEKRECEEGGKRVFPDFTEEGCEKVMCVDKDACIREISPGFARHCQQKGDGGEAIAHRNSDGCIEYMDCVHRGERNIEYRQVGELPDPTKLLSIALKLEEMSMKFEEIKRKILALADYAKSIGSEKDERRYRSAANMVGDTRGQLERIKSQLRGRRGEMSKEEFERIINELREVVYESTERIAWALLSDGAGREFEGERREYMPEEADEFLKAFDLCVPNQVITPPDTDEVTITILGPGDNACKWNVLSREGPPGVVMEMTCESSRRDFEQMGGGKPGLNEVEEWGCTGPMADALKSGDLGPQEGQQQEQYQKQYKEPGPKEGSGGSCSGCLDNGICDPGECSDCKDCIGGMK